MKGLILHAGANVATLDDVKAVRTPEATESWQPIPHSYLIRVVKETLARSEFRVDGEEYGLWNDGDRMFGVLSLTNGRRSSDYSLTLGVRNSHDKRFPAGFAAGSRVFVCDNLAFSSEIVMARRHTRYILRDLPGLVAGALGQLGDARDKQDARIEAYRRTELSDTVVHDLLIRSVDARVMANAYIAKVLDQWRNPNHEEFAERTAWSLFNAYTEVFKETNPLDLPSRTERLHGLLDLAATAEGHDPNQIIIDLPEPEPVALVTA